MLKYVYQNNSVFLEKCVVADLPALGIDVGTVNDALVCDTILA